MTAETTPWTPPTDRRRPVGWRPEIFKSRTPGIYIVESVSRPGVFHTVRSVGTPFAECSCEAAQYRPGTVCTHVRWAIHADRNPGGAGLPVPTTSESEKQE